LARKCILTKGDFLARQVRFESTADPLTFIAKPTAIAGKLIAEFVNVEWASPGLVGYFDGYIVESQLAHQFCEFIGDVFFVFAQCLMIINRN
jgi:hypothetical protein